MEGWSIFTSLILKIWDFIEVAPCSVSNYSLSCEYNEYILSRVVHNIYFVVVEFLRSQYSSKTFRMAFQFICMGLKIKEIDFYKVLFLILLKKRLYQSEVMVVGLKFLPIAKPFIQL